MFERHGPDVFAVLEVPMVQAALGGEVQVDTLDGTERVGIDPGTESGTTVRLRGKGIPNLGRGGRGDLFLTIAVQTPRDLSKEQRGLVEELARLRGETAGKRTTTHVSGMKAAKLSEALTFSSTSNPPSSTASIGATSAHSESSAT